MDTLPPIDPETRQAATIGLLEALSALLETSATALVDLDALDRA